MSEKNEETGKNFEIAGASGLEGFVEDKELVLDGVVFSKDIKGKLVFPERKKHSVIAMNLETVEDVNKVIEQCEIIKQEFAVQERKLKVMEVPDCKEKEV